MNEFTTLLMFLVAPLSTAPTGVGNFSLTINEPGHVRVYHGTVEYDKQTKDKILCRVEVTSETTIPETGEPTRKELTLQLIAHLAAKNSQIHTRGFPGERDYTGPYNFGAMIYNAHTALELKTLDEKTSRRIGLLEKMAFVTVENAADANRVSCLTAERPTPTEKAWIKNNHVVSLTYHWQDKTPDAARFEMPAK